jgi:hypothetical protein
MPWAPVAGLGGWLTALTHSPVTVGAAVGTFGALVLIRALEGFGETWQVTC